MSLQYSNFSIGRTLGKVAFLALCFVYCAPVSAHAEEQSAAEAQFDLAEEQRYERGEPGRAVEAYRAVVARWPRSEWAPRALDMIAFIQYHDRRDSEAAVKTYEELAVKYPGSPEADYGEFVAGRLLFRVLDNPQAAVAKHAQFIMRSREQGRQSDPAATLAKAQVWGAAERLCLDPGRSLPAKERLEFKGHVRSARFGICFPGDTSCAAAYELTDETKTFRLESRQPSGGGVLAVWVKDLYEPMRSTEEGKPHPYSVKMHDFMILARVDASKTYLVEGLKHRGRLRIKRSFESTPFSVYFTNAPDAVVRLDYDVSGPKRTFSFGFDEIVTDVRGTLKIPLKEWVSLIVLEEGRPVDSFRTDGLAERIARKKDEKMKLLRARGGRPPPLPPLVLVVEQIDPTKRYVVQPVTAMLGSELETPGAESPDVDLDFDFD